MGYNDISVIANYKNSEFEERVGKSLKGETNAEFSKIEESKNRNSVSRESAHNNAQVQVKKVKSPVSSSKSVRWEVVPT